MKLINVRGTNGTGKSTAIRTFLQHEPANFSGNENSPVKKIDLHYYTEEMKTGTKDRFVEGYANNDDLVIVVGDYSTMAGGMDKIKKFEYAFAAIRKAVELAELHEFKAVVFEGILASTVWGSWGAFAAEMRDEGHEFIFMGLEVPLDVALARIQRRNGGKPVNEEQVAAKISAVESSLQKAATAGFRVETCIVDEDLEDAGHNTIIANSPQGNFLRDIVNGEPHVG